MTILRFFKFVLVPILLAGCTSDFSRRLDLHYLAKQDYDCRNLDLPVLSVSELWKIDNAEPRDPWEGETRGKCVRVKGIVLDATGDPYLVEDAFSNKICNSDFNRRCLVIGRARANMQKLKKRECEFVVLEGVLFAADMPMQRPRRSDVEWYVPQSSRGDYFGPLVDIRIIEASDAGRLACEAMFSN